MKAALLFVALLCFGAASPVESAAPRDSIHAPGDAGAVATRSTRDTATDTARAQSPARIDWAKVTPWIIAVVSIFGGPWVGNKLAERRERRKAAEDEARRLRERNDEVRRMDADLRRALAIRVEAYLRQWGALLRSVRDEGFENLAALGGLERDTEAFHEFEDRLGNIQGQAQRGYAMAWCLGAGRLSNTLLTVHSFSGEPAPGTDALGVAVHRRLRAKAVAEVQTLLDAGERLRPWVDIFDEGEGGGLVQLPGLPPPM